MTEKIIEQNKVITITGKDQEDIDNKKIKLGLLVKGILPATKPVKQKSRRESGADSADIYKAAKNNIIQEED